eukprot:g17858.t1
MVVEAALFFGVVHRRGINSTNAVIFRNKLTSEFKDLELPATLVFDYPTVRALQGLVVEQTTAAALANAPEPMWAANAAMAQMAMAAHRAVDAVAVRRKIQEVTKGMVGSDLDIATGRNSPSDRAYWHLLF